MKLYYHEADKEILLGWVKENWDGNFNKDAKNNGY